MARLQHGRGTRAGEGGHEGGIILSKKPPEWHLPLPQPSNRKNVVQGKSVDVRGGRNIKKEEEVEATTTEDN